MPATDDNLDTAFLAGQCLVVGFEGVMPDRATAEVLSRLRPAGIILFSRNLQERSQVRDLMHDLGKLCMPRMICIDQEGGRVDRLRTLFPSFPSPERLAQLGKASAFYDYGRYSAQVLHSLGFNVNFAPVLDLPFHDGDNALRGRYLAGNSELVTAFARAYLAGLQGEGVFGCGKHFPGLGRARLDSHLQLPAIEVTVEQLLEFDLQPYRRLRQQLKMVMVNHASYPELEREAAAAPTESGHAPMPASCLAATYRLLRERVGFTGIALTDDLDMGAVRQAVPVEEIAVSGFRAGADLLLIGSDLGFAGLCQERLMKLFEDPHWRKQAIQRGRKLTSLPPLLPVDLERIKELGDIFSGWKRGLHID